MRRKAARVFGARQAECIGDYRRPSAVNRSPSILKKDVIRFAFSGVSNLVETPKSRLIKVCFDLENE